jgi:menaquinone-dependent protoporphyrinogen oxidase
MDHKVLVAYASRHGSTQGIAERIASALRANHVDAIALPVEAVRDADGYDGYVIGSAVYATHWLGPVKSFVHRHRVVLKRHPVWLFSSGPLSNEPSELAEAAPRDIADIERDIEARGHVVFAGAWDRDAKPIGLLEKAMSVIPAARDALPAADYRDWSAVDAFATSVAGELGLALETD